jgi:hypothetical protein
VPWTEVRLELPDTVLRRLADQAGACGVSVEVLIVTLLAKSQVVGDEPGSEQ